MSILDEIFARKRYEVATAQRILPTAELEREAEQRHLRSLKRKSSSEAPPPASRNQELHFVRADADDT